MGMVTITGVAAGMATITVTAMDMGVGGEAMMNRMSASQDIKVTVESTEEPMLGPPSGVMASITFVDGDPGRPNIVVNWNDGENASRHIVALFDTSDADNPMLVSGSFQAAAGGMHTYDNVASPGFYTPVVLSIMDDADGSVDSYMFAVGNQVEVQ